MVITLRELKGRVRSWQGARVPTFKALEAAGDTGQVVVATRTAGMGRLRVYESGLVTYEREGRGTVFPLHRLGGVRYGEGEEARYLPPAAFEEMDWAVRLLLEGERRLEANGRDRQRYHERSVPTPPPLRGGREAEEETGVPWSEGRLQRLTPRQREALRLRFGEGLRQVEVARRMGITKQTVSELLRKAITKLREP